MATTSDHHPLRAMSKLRCVLSVSCLSGALFGVSAVAPAAEQKPKRYSANWASLDARPKQENGEYKVKYNVMDQIGQAPKEGVAVKQVFFTKKPGALYAITAGWPGKQLVLRGVKAPANAKVTMLGVPGALASVVAGDTVTIATPDLGPGEALCRHAYTFKIEGGEALPEQ